ncbi:MAG: heavy metal-binding domain-containing protein, partial [Sphingobium sp.]
MRVDPAATPHHAEHAGRSYHFCSGNCRARFAADPARYLEDRDQEQPQAVAGSIWTCPMHPEVRQDHPGACPICGMALEPAVAEAASEPNAELA